VEDIPSTAKGQWLRWPSPACISEAELVGSLHSRVFHILKDAFSVTLTKESPGRIRRSKKSSLDNKNTAARDLLLYKTRDRALVNIDGAAGLVDTRRKEILYSYPHKLPARGSIAIQTC
jgi:hypothetical protein